ncbi:glycosyltransferase [Candidatus Pelagibacter sp.]|nr:glycosyltransferase [Candidatus Pelagibacter sp.]
MLKISIITPVMNGEKHLKKCLKSVSNQNYPKKYIEHIVIDGGSTDKSVSIIKNNKKVIKYWQTKKDKGLYDAMNIGLQKCTGDIIGILNSDDFYYKNTFKITSRYFDKLNIDFLFGSVLKHKIFHNFYPNKIWYTFNIYPSHSVSFFIKRKIHKKLGNYNLKFKYSADRDLFYRMITKFNLVGTSTKRSEIFGKFNLFGISSRVPFLIKIFEEIRIRLSNRQNFFQVLFVTISYSSYYLINKIIKRFN